MTSEARSWLSGQLHALLRATYGLDLTRGGSDRALADHLESRLALAESARPEFDLLERVLANVEGERDHLLQAVTVGHSWFFRDPAQLAEIGELFTSLASRLRRPLEVWVAGCSAGEEAWTLALIADSLGVAVRVLATDVSPAAIANARAAHYNDIRLRDVPVEFRPRFLAVDSGRWRLDVATFSERVRVEFAVHNLCDEPPEREFDVIVCRNVLIYIEPERARAILARLRTYLRPMGKLVLGGIDQLADVSSLRAPPTRPDRPPQPASPNSSPPDRPVERPTIDEALGRASEAIAAGRVDEAIAELEPRVDEDPLQAEVHFWIGLAHHHAGRPEPAIASFRRAQCLTPSLWPASLFAALAHERRASWPAAQRCWTELERALASPLPSLPGSPALLEALPGWRDDALALARTRLARPLDPAGSTRTNLDPAGSTRTISSPKPKS